MACPAIATTKLAWAARSGAVALPADLADAIADHDQRRPLPERPRTMSDVVYLANLLAGGLGEWVDVPDGNIDAERVAQDALLAEFGAEVDHVAQIDDHEAILLGAFA